MGPWHSMIGCATTHTPSSPRWWTKRHWVPSAPECWGQKAAHTAFGQLRPIAILPGSTKWGVQVYIRHIGEARGIRRTKPSRVQERAQLLRFGRSGCVRGSRHAIFTSRFCADLPITRPLPTRLQNLACHAPLPSRAFAKHAEHMCPCTTNPWKRSPLISASACAKDAPRPQ